MFRIVGQDTKNYNQSKGYMDQDIRSNPHQHGTQARLKGHNIEMLVVQYHHENRSVLLSHYTYNTKIQMWHAIYKTFDHMKQIRNLFCHKIDMR